MKQTTFKLIPLVFICLPSASFGQGRVDIVQIYQNFLASRIAALECKSVDKTTEPRFLSNQLTVTVRASQALKERNPGVSDTDLAAKIVAAQNATQTAVKTEVAQKGCSSERVQQLLKMYKLHSEMSLGG